MPQDDEFISYDELQEEADSEHEPSGGGGLSTLTIILIGILIVTIGGLSSYYYYTFQAQGQSYEEQITKSWDEVINASVQLNDELQNVESPSDLSDMESTVRDTNTTIRTGVLFDLPQPPITSRSGTHEDLTTFLNNYLDYLSELQSIAARGEEIESVEELNSLQSSADTLQTSYTELKSSSGGQLSAVMPDGFFEFPENYEEGVAQFLEEKEESSEEISNTVSERATQFMQAIVDDDLESAQEFVVEDQQDALPALIQGSVDIQGFSVGSAEVGEDQEEVEVSGVEEVETPDNQTQERTRIFIFENVDEEWLISSWRTEETGENNNSGDGS